MDIFLLQKPEEPTEVSSLEETTHFPVDSTDSGDLVAATTTSPNEDLELESNTVKGKLSKYFSDVKTLLRYKHFFKEIPATTETLALAGSELQQHDEPEPVINIEPASFAAQPQVFKALSIP